MKSVLIYSEAIIRMNFNHKDGVNFDCARVRFVSRFCISRLTHLNMKRAQENEKSRRSPEGRLYVLLMRALALPEGAYGVNTTY